MHTPTVNHRSLISFQALGAMLAVALIAAGSARAGLRGTAEDIREKVEGSEIKYLVTLHATITTAERGTKFARRIMTKSGETLTVARIPLISSAAFMRITAVADRHGALVPKAQLSQHGRMLWMQIRAGRAGRPVVVAVDGVYHHTMRVPRLGGDENSLLLGGEWDREELENVVRWSVPNYLAITDKD